MTESNKRSTSKKVSVLYLTSSLKVGGAERLLVDLCSYYANSKSALEKVRLFYVVMNDLVDLDLKRELENSGAEGWFFGRKEGHKHPKYLFMLIDIVKKNKIDVIHAHTSGSKYWGMVLKVLFPSLKLYYTVHSTFDVVRYKGIKLKLHQTLVDWNICISKICKEQCMERGLIKSSVINNGINISKFKPRRELTFSDVPKLVTVSRIVPHIKGQDLILEALSLCVKEKSPFHITIIGDTSGNYRKSYEALLALIQKLSIPTELVTFLGLRTEIGDLLLDYEGYICASRKEGLGLSIIEGMAAKLLVISCDEEGPSEIIENEKTGFLFETGNAEALAKKIMEVFYKADKKILIEICEKAHTSSKSYDIVKMFDKYADIYSGQFL